MTTQSVAPTTEQFVAEISRQARAGQTERAMDLARAALGRGLVHPLFFNLRAYWLQDQGMPREALADLEQAAQLAPDDLPIRYELGLALARFDRWTDAAAQFETATRLDPRHYRAWFNLASARECMGDLNGARRDFEHSLELSPGEAQPLAALANLAARRADWVEARRLAESALAADPQQYLALTVLANTAVQTGELSNAESLLTAALADPALPPAERAMLSTLKGDLRHAEQRYDEAFAAYGDANAMRQRLFAGTYAEPGRETAATFTELLIETFAPVPKEQWSVAARAAAQAAPSPSPSPARPKRARAKAAGSEPASAELARPGPAGPRPTGTDIAGPALTSHVFLIGFARSGTTLLENVLAGHPGVVTVEEKELLADSVREYFATDKTIAMLADAGESQLAPLRESYWRHAAQYCPALDGKVFVDKRPMGASRLPLIAKLFPSARILFAVRDPRDVILSCFRRQFVLSAPMYQLLDLRSAARFYALTMQFAMLCKDKFDQPWHFTRHEPFVHDFDGELAKICGFIGIERDDAMRDFAQGAQGRAIASNSSTQVIRGLNEDGIGVWQHYRAHLAPVFPTLRPWIENFGYTAG